MCHAVVTASLTSLILFGIAGAILSWVYQYGHNIRYDCVDRNATKKCQLLIAILSARNHSDQRNAIRQTWFPKNYSSNSNFCVEAQFVVGQRSCLLPPEDRIDVYDCKPWHINLTEVGSSATVHFSSSVLDTNHHERIHKDSYQSSSVNIGIHFKVLHPVIISKLGISSSIISLNESATVVLRSTVTQGEIAEVHFSPQRTGKAINGYHYRPIEPIILPKGYEGMLILSEPVLATNASTDLFSNLHSNAGGLLKFYQVISNEGIGHPFHSHSTLAVSFGYSIYDLQALNVFIKDRKIRQENWNSQLIIENSLLHEEMQQYQDITLVDVTDIYRNLPLKLLAFYQSAVAQYNFEFILKTDDDSILHIEKILQELEQAPSRWKTKMVWWGRFRYNWLVECYGKWQEIEFEALVYPPFACGVAYVLSSNAIQWLAKNWQELHIYQGEDISLGIWLSAIGPLYAQDKRWQCDEGCQEDSLSRGQLTPHEIQRTWTSLKENGNFCS